MYSSKKPVLTMSGSSQRSRFAASRAQRHSAPARHRRRGIPKSRRRRHLIFHTNGRGKGASQLDVSSVESREAGADAWSMRRRVSEIQSEARIALNFEREREKSLNAQRPRTYTQPTQPTSCWSIACTHTTRPPRGQASPVFFLLRSASCVSGSNS